MPPAATWVRPASVRGVATTGGACMVIGEQARRRDEEFTEFVIGARARLCRVAFLMWGDRHRAEDIVQTALIAVHSRWGSIDREIGPYGYVHRAVVNAAIDEHRRP